VTSVIPDRKQVPCRPTAERPALLWGCAALSVGVAITLIGVVTSTAVPFLLGSAVAGVVTDAVVGASLAALGVLAGRRTARHATADAAPPQGHRSICRPLRGPSRSACMAAPGQAAWRGEDGGSAQVTTLDVLDRDAVEQHATAIAARSGIDICFNATSNDDLQGIPLLDLDFADFLRPVTKAVTAHHHIATATGRHMTRRGAGVILVMAGGREAIPRLGGSHVAWSALVGLCRQLAAEFGPHGVRVNWLLSPGSPGFDDGAPTPSAEPAPGTDGLLPRHQPSYDEVANIATFAASDWARTMTASEINFTGGAVID
jgi:3-oxoacyl-[acyl-carrier protein] reductase